MPLSRRNLATYAALGLPLSFAGLPLYLYVPDYYAVTHGVPLALIGVILLALRLVDAVQDPLIGLWVAGRVGDAAARRRMLGAGAGGMAVGLVMLFNPPPTLNAALWLAGTLLLATTAFSLVSILYQSLGAAWQVPVHDRTRVVAWREGVALLGLLLAAVLPGVLQPAIGAVAAFQIYVGVFVPLLLLGLWLCQRWARQSSFAADALAPQTGRSIRPAGRRGIYGVIFLSQFASAFPAVLFLFFVRDRLEAEALTGAFLGLYFLSAAAGMPLWTGLSRRIGKRRAWQTGIALAVAVFLWAAFLGPGDTTAFFVICVLSGVALGADLALPASLLADRLRDAEGGNAAVTFGWVTFLGKAALALASGVALPVLGTMFGYVPGGDNPPGALTALAAGYAAVPCVLKAIACLCLFRIDLPSEIPHAPYPDPQPDGCPDSDRLRRD
jgi:glycoside/pentoside/hexuronide:cation symporter, GPH family